MAIKHQGTNITVVKHQGTTLATVYHQGTKVFPDTPVYSELNISIGVWSNTASVTVDNPNSFDVYFNCNVYVQTSSESVEYTVTDQLVSAYQSRTDTIYDGDYAVESVYLDFYNISGGGCSWSQEADW